MVPAKRQRFAQRVTTAVFVALVMTPWLLARYDAKESAAGSPAHASTYGFMLSECAESLGVRFIHQAPELDPKVANIEPYIAMVGASVAVVDADNDGRPDLYATTSRAGEKNALFRNNGDGTFKDFAEDVGLADLNRPGTGVSMGTVWGDYDNDGDDDVLLYKWGRLTLLRNDGGLSFVDVSDEAGIGRWMNANAATWWDFNNDGRLDLYIGGYFPEQLDLADLSTTNILANSFEYATNGGGNYLFMNRGDGTFEDVTERLNADPRKWTFALAAADLNGDGFQDLYIANDYGSDVVLINREGRRFDQRKPGGAGDKPKSGMNAALGDIQNDGTLSVFVTNISKAGFLSQGNDLWTGVVGRSVNVAVPAGVATTGWSWGAQFGDLDNDGWVDLYVTNGFISADPHGDYWYDMARMAQGTGALFEDARNWPPIGNRSLSGFERSALFLNDRAGGFHNVALSTGVTDTYDGRAVAFSDLDDDGDLDVIVANQRGPLLVYRNRVDPDRAWIAFDLVGTRSNRDAYGALVTLSWNSTQQTTALLSASGFAAQNSRRVHFGLGKDPHVHRATIRWPSGTVQVVERPEPDRVHRIIEPDVSAPTTASVGRK